MPFEFGNFAALGFSAVVMVLYGIIGVFPLLYAFAKWRSGPTGAGHGLQAGLLYLRSVALLVFVTGLALMLHSLVDKDNDSRGMVEMRRVAGGLLVGGGVGLALYLWLLRGVSLASHESVRRLFDGYVLMVSGFITLVTTTLTGIVMFQKNTNFDDLRAPLVWTAVWLVTFLIHAAALVRGVRGAASAP